MGNQASRKRIGNLIRNMLQSTTRLGWELIPLYRPEHPDQIVAVVAADPRYLALGLDALPPGGPIITMPKGDCEPTPKTTG